MNRTTNYISRDDLDSVIGELKQEFNTRFDEVMNGIVDISGQLRVMKEEMDVLPYQVTMVRDMAEDHEKRITKLEHAKTI